MTILIPLPAHGFDPAESSIPWKLLTQEGHKVVFATPNGEPGKADPRMLTGKGLGPLKLFLITRKATRSVYFEMEQSAEFLNPIPYYAIMVDQFDGLVIPGGHAKGVKTCVESAILQDVVAEFFERNLPVGAVCHGVLLPARSRSKKTGKSVLWGRKTTAVTRGQELTSWGITRLWLGDYFRTYPVTVEDEVKEVLESKDDFLQGPLTLRMDSWKRPDVGFVVRDKNYVSARWFGDIHRFSLEFLKVLKEAPRTSRATIGALAN